jgi:hypothetical protein
MAMNFVYFYWHFWGSLQSQIPINGLSQFSISWHHLPISPFLFLMVGCEYGCLCWCFSWAVEHPVYNQLVQTPSSRIWLCYSFWRINLSHFLSVVSKIWAKKSAIGKEEAAKLVDDTYRFIIACYSIIRGCSSIFSLFSF